MGPADGCGILWDGGIAATRDGGSQALVNPQPGSAELALGSC